MRVHGLGFGVSGFGGGFGLQAGRAQHAASLRSTGNEGDATLKKGDFRTFYRDAHAVECLTEREKMLIGLTVAMTRLCDP